MLSRKILMPVIAVVVAGGVAFAGTELVHAQTSSNPLSGLAQAIAQKFHLNQSDVQSAINTYQQQHKADRQQVMQDRLKTKLDTEVKNGKLTSAQEQAILQELSSLQSKYNPTNMKNLTPVQRQQQFQNMQNDFKSWASSQGIDLSLIPMGMGRGGRMFGHKLMMSPTP